MERKLSPFEFERKYNIREIENCVSCKHSENFDYYEYCTCKHPDRIKPHTIKYCTECICDKWETSNSN